MPGSGASAGEVTGGGSKCASGRYVAELDCLERRESGIRSPKLGRGF